MSASERWLLRARAWGPIERRLVCVPFAGAGASLYRSWAEAAPLGLEICRVQLPGREDRANEPLCTALPEVIERLAESLGDGVPTAVFGHSLGGLIAFELALELERRGSRLLRVFASASRPPHVPDPYQLHRLAPDPFIEALRQRGGMQPELLQHPELRELLLPLLRADLELAERWCRDTPASIAAPLTVLAAPLDAVVPWALTAEWKRATRGGFERLPVAGDHFFIRTQPRAIFDLVLERLGD